MTSRISINWPRLTGYRLTKPVPWDLSFPTCLSKYIQQAQPIGNFCDGCHRQEVRVYSPLPWRNSAMRFFLSLFLGRLSFLIQDMRLPSQEPSRCEAALSGAIPPIINQVWVKSQYPLPNWDWDKSEFPLPKLRENFSFHHLIINS